MGQVPPKGSAGEEELAAGEEDEEAPAGVYAPSVGTQLLTNQESLAPN